MYTIFSTKIKKLKYLEEGEPPPKKAVTEKDILIKKLAENQLTTNITLAEQLNRKKEFTSSESLTNVTSYISGKTDLKEFQTTVADIDELNSLKSKGLSNRDIEIYREYKTLGPQFWIKYKSISEDVLFKHIKEIDERVNSMSNYSDGNTAPSTSHHEESLGSLKSQIPEHIKVSVNNKTKQSYVPMDELPNLEKQIMDCIKEYSSCDIKKIRKKARSLGNKINNLDRAGNIVNTEECEETIHKIKNPQKSTLWDVRKEPTYFQKKVEIIDKDKIYTCKKQNWYTIKDGKITKLDENKAIPQNILNTQKDIEKPKLTVEEIKNIPKFSNYNQGSPSKVLYVKNLGKNITEVCLKKLLNGFQEQCYSVKIMNGKMKGQAFIEFQDEAQASQALEELNGIVIEGKPIIVQFGRRKDPDYKDNLNCNQKHLL